MSPLGRPEGETRGAQLEGAPVNTGWLQALARLAYSMLLWLATPLYLLRLWRRGAAEPLYRHALGERLGFYRDAASTGWVWVHAVSLGETRACAALVAALRAQRPGMRLLLTHGTATGCEAGRTLLQTGDRQTWLPYDTAAAARRFITHFRPAVGVLMETEIWPNVLHAARAQGVPMLLANARLSERSLQKGLRLRALLRPAVQCLTAALAQTDDDAQRLRASGAGEVLVMGNLKYDMAPDAALLARGRAWRAALARSVVLVASSREGEEAELLAGWAALVAPRPLLWLVPRHPQRFDAVAQLVADARLTLVRRSAWADTPLPDAQAADVWLGDSMGEMALYYGGADVALLGGSFAALGGQNLIEAAACGCPVVMGPHTFNFTEASVLAEQAGAAIRVADLGAGIAQAILLSANPARHEEAVSRSLAFAQRHRGAAARMAAHIVGAMPTGHRRSDS